MNASDFDWDDFLKASGRRDRERWRLGTPALVDNLAIV